MNVYEITVTIFHLVRLLRQPLFVSTVETSSEFIGHRRCGREKKKEILITFGEEDKSLIIHAKRGSPELGPRGGSIYRAPRVYARSGSRGVCVVPHYV